MGVCVFRLSRVVFSLLNLYEEDVVSYDLRQAEDMLKAASR